MFKYLTEFFSFTRKELNGLLVFCMLLLIVLLVPLAASWFRSQETYDFSRFKKEIAEFRASEIKRSGQNYHKDYEDVEALAKAPVYFRFNPNQLPEADWQKLGLSKKQIRVIKNYEAKGGKFWKKEDLKRIYSIDALMYSKLEPYINIPEEYHAYGRVTEEGGGARKYFKNIAVVVDLNSADSATLQTVRGIGPVLASRIVRYRDRLGGFCRKEQLREVYGIDSVRYSSLEGQIIVNPGPVRKLNFNTATFDDIKGYPYLSYKQMNAIIQYRKQHGPYSGINDLKKIAILNEEILRKIAPYLIF
ncbi:ComEA family DNA-binding protein [Arcticibacter tournemirensis]